MDTLREWFSAELQRLGFAGLEGVYDYLQSMSDDQVVNYLHSLLGSTPIVNQFAASYVSFRTTGKTSPSLLQASSSSATDSSFSQWTNSPGNRGGGSKKGRRGRGKNKSTNRNPGKKQSPPSFARAVSKEGSSTSNSVQAKAIENSPVEQARQKIREYRQSRKPINCLNCGKIQILVREDGTCSFCSAPIFSIYGIPTHRAVRDVRGDETQERMGTNHNFKKTSTVLGRYVVAPERRSEISVVNLAGNSIFVQNEETKNESSKSKELATRCYRSESITDSELAGACQTAISELQRFIASGGSGSSTVELEVRGRLQIDAISPSVKLS